MQTAKQVKNDKEVAVGRRSRCKNIFSKWCMDPRIPTNIGAKHALHTWTTSRQATLEFQFNILVPTSVCVRTERMRADL